MKLSQKKFGEGTDFDLDYGKLLLLLYIHCSMSKKDTRRDAWDRETVDYS